MISDRGAGDQFQALLIEFGWIKLDLIDDLWRSLTPDELPLSPQLREELDRRLNRLEREGLTGIPWEDVRAEMTGRKV